MGNCIKVDTTSTRYQGYTSYPTGTSDPLLREEETDNVSVYTALGDSKSFLIVHTYALVHTQLFVNYRDRGYYKICKPPGLFYVRNSVRLVFHTHVTVTLQYTSIGVTPVILH